MTSKKMKKIGGCKHDKAAPSRAILFNGKGYVLNICAECAEKKIQDDSVLKLDVAGIQIGS
jgi:hypothetical protein